MKITKAVVLVLVLSVCLVEGRHLHLRSIMKTNEETPRRIHEAIALVDGIPNNVIRNIKPNRFVPINNVMFFSGPCENGFERDLIGVCREVWD